MKKAFAGSIAIVGWLSLILQFVLHMNSAVAQEISFAERFIRFFSYFTVLTNIVVAATFTGVAFFSNTRFGQFSSKPTTQAAVTSYISIVGIVYSLFLRSVWDPQGWQAVADHALHDVIPILAVIYWLACAPKSGIFATEPIKWLAYPVFYLAYSLGRGAIVNWYPYWFADVTQLGYRTALRNAALVLIAFAIVGYIYFGLAKLLARTANDAIT